MVAVVAVVAVAAVVEVVAGWGGGFRQITHRFDGGPRPSLQQQPPQMKHLGEAMASIFPRGMARQQGGRGLWGALYPARLGLCGRRCCPIAGTV